MTVNSELLNRDSPKPDESFLGYIVRLTEANGYDTPSWLRMKSGMNYLSTSNEFLFNPSFDLGPFSVLTGVPAEKLESLLYRSPAGNERFRQIVTKGPTAVPRQLIRLNRTKVCPRCLAEMGYAKKIWDLVPVTACPHHNCLLLDACPGCNKQISWMRKALFSCACGHDLRNGDTPSIKQADLRLTRLFYEKCGLLETNRPDDKDREINPLFKLELNDLVVAVVFIAHQNMARARGMAVAHPFTLSNAMLHEALSDAFALFEAWPENFNKFLDQVCNRSDGIPVVGGLKRCFGQFFVALRVGLRSHGCNFLHEAFEDYLSTRWDSGLISARHKLRFPMACRKNRYVGIFEAKRKLHVSQLAVERFIRKGLLRGTIRAMAKKRVFRIERNSIEKLRKRMDKSLNATQAAEVLDISFGALIDLVKCDCIVPLLSPSMEGESKYLFERKVLVKFVSRISGMTEKSRLATKGGLVGIQDAIKTVSFLKIGIGKFVSELFAANIRPRGEGSGKGLSRFLFEMEELVRYGQMQLRRSKGNFLSIRDVAKRLDMKEQNVTGLVQMGLLTASAGNSDLRCPNLGRLINEKDVEDFKSRYVSVVELARVCKTSSKFLTRYFSRIGVEVAFGRKDHRYLRHLYRRSDMPKEDLAEAVAAAKRARKPKKRLWSTTLIDVKSTAEILGISMDELDQIVRRGDINSRLPKRSEKNNAGSLHFSRRVVERYKLWRMDSRDLVSVAQAADLLGEDRSIFEMRWVQTRRLARVEYKDPHGKHFYRRSDVEKLVKLKKIFVTGSETAAILGVNRREIYRLRKEGGLKFVTGPDVKGFRSPRYLREDVEALCHQKRQSR